MLNDLKEKISVWKNNHKIAFIIKGQNEAELTFAQLAEGVQFYVTLMQSLTKATLVLSVEYLSVDFLMLFLAAILCEWNVVVMPPKFTANNLLVIDDRIIQQGSKYITAQLLQMKNKAQFSALPRHSVMFFTSGSTGEPKGVVHSYKSMGLLCEFLNKILKSKDITQANVFAYSKVYHLSFIMIMFGSLWAGQKCIYADPQYEFEFTSYFVKYSINVAWFVPSFIFSYKDLFIELKDQFKLLLLGGEEISPWFFSAFPGIIQFGFGMTECPIVTVGDDSFQSANSYLLGNPYLSELQIAGQQLAIKSPLLCSGYWHDSTFENLLLNYEGFFVTNDLVAYDELQRWVFIGRKEYADKLTVFNQGNNVFLYENQLKAMLTPYIRENYIVYIHPCKNRFILIIENHAQDVLQDYDFIKEIIFQKLGDNYLDKILILPEFSRGGLKIDKKKILSNIQSLL